MAGIKFQLGPEDAAKLPGGDEWFTYDRAAIMAMPARQLIALERRMGGYTLAQIEADFAARGVLGLLGVMFIARHLAGVNEKWDNFDPQVWQAEWDVAADEETVPPTGETEASPTT